MCVVLQLVLRVDYICFVDLVKARAIMGLGIVFVADTNIVRVRVGVRIRSWTWLRLGLLMARAALVLGAHTKN